jgi:hypothetical protein
MNKKLTEILKIDKAVVNSDITTPRTSNYYSMSDYRKAVAVLLTDTIANTKKATLQFKQAKDSQGTDSTNLGSAVEVTVANPAGEQVKVVGEIDVSAMDINNGFTHIAVTISSDNATAVIAACTLIRGNARYNQE